MPNADLAAIASAFNAAQPALPILRQHRLFSADALVSFCRDRGVPAQQSISIDAAVLVRDWVIADPGIETHAEFHPFRLSVLDALVESSSLVGMRLVSPDPEPAHRLFDHCLRATFNNPEKITEAAALANGIATLAILLEPVFWSRLVGNVYAWSARTTKEEYKRQYRAYRDDLLGPLIASLDVTRWEQQHEKLRIRAAHLDRNTDLYLFLRAARWEKRLSVRGSLGAALWTRHIAEVIRRGFEYFREVRWLEEDIAFGMWSAVSRRQDYGNDRPLDDTFQSAPYLVAEFGLLRGSVLRWYVEGETEFGAIQTLLPKAQRFGIELVNLGGDIATGKGNAALKLGGLLDDDRALRRFSMITFDTDVRANVKAFSRMCHEGRVVGFATVHEPDLEFANFTISELQEIAAGFVDDPELSETVRRANWGIIKKGAVLSERFAALTGRSLKSEAWGHALAEYALVHPERADRSGVLRPLLEQVRTARRCWTFDYDAHERDFTIDPTTFQLKPRSGEDNSE